MNCESNLSHKCVTANYYRASNSVNYEAFNNAKAARQGITRMTSHNGKNP